MDRINKSNASLQEYLVFSSRITKASIASGKQEKVNIVVGNEACDLDSAVCSLVYAYHLWKKSGGDTCSETVGVIPVLNIPEEDYSLKTEVVFALREQGIERSHLVFTEHVDPVRLHGEGNLELTLVDHHLPVGKFAHLVGAVVEVVDHHTIIPGKNFDFLKNIHSTLEPVGSCSTLVAEKMLGDPLTKSISPITAFLLYETIVVDTVNFSDSARKATAKDRHVCDELQKMLLSAPTREQIFQRILEAKADISRLSVDQLLRKDLKILEVQHIKLAVASIPRLACECLGSEANQNDLEVFCQAHSYTGVVLLGVAMSGPAVKRDILVFVPEISDVDKQIGSQLLNDFCNNAQVELGLNPDPTFVARDQRYHYFRQGNVAASRKQILPLLHGLVEKYLQSLQGTGLTPSPPETALSTLSPAALGASAYFISDPVSPNTPPKAAKRLGISPVPAEEPSATDNADGGFHDDFDYYFARHENGENQMLSLQEALDLPKEEQVHHPTSLPFAPRAQLTAETNRKSATPSPSASWSEDSMHAFRSDTPDILRVHGISRPDGGSRTDTVDGLFSPSSAKSPQPATENQTGTSSVSWTTIPARPVSTEGSNKTTPALGFTDQMLKNEPLEEETNGTGDSSKKNKHDEARPIFKTGDSREPTFDTDGLGGEVHQPVKENTNSTVGKEPDTAATEYPLGDLGANKDTSRVMYAVTGAIRFQNQTRSNSAKTLPEKLTEPSSTSMAGRTEPTASSGASVSDCLTSRCSRNSSFRDRNVPDSAENENFSLKHKDLPENYPPSKKRCLEVFRPTTPLPGDSSPYVPTLSPTEENCGPSSAVRKRGLDEVDGGPSEQGAASKKRDTAQIRAEATLRTTHENAEPVPDTSATNSDGDAKASGKSTEVVGRDTSTSPAEGSSVDGSSVDGSLEKRVPEINTVGTEKKGHEDLGFRILSERALAESSDAGGDLEKSIENKRGVDKMWGVSSRAAVSTRQPGAQEVLTGSSAEQFETSSTASALQSDVQDVVDGLSGDTSSARNMKNPTQPSTANVPGPTLHVPPLPSTPVLATSGLSPPAGLTVDPEFQVYAGLSPVATPSNAKETPQFGIETPKGPAGTEDAGRAFSMNPWLEKIESGSAQVAHTIGQEQAVEMPESSALDISSDRKNADAEPENKGSMNTFPVRNDLDQSQASQKTKCGFGAEPVGLTTQTTLNASESSTRQTPAVAPLELSNGSVQSPSRNAPPNGFDLYKYLNTRSPNKDASDQLDGLFGSPSSEGSEYFSPLGYARDAFSQTEGVLETACGLTSGTVYPERELLSALKYEPSPTSDDELEVGSDEVDAGGTPVTDQPGVTEALDYNLKAEKDTARTAMWDGADKSIEGHSKVENPGTPAEDYLEIASLSIVLPVEDSIVPTKNEQSIRTADCEDEDILNVKKGTWSDAGLDVADPERITGSPTAPPEGKPIQHGFSSSTDSNCAEPKLSVVNFFQPYAPANKSPRNVMAPISQMSPEEQRRELFQHSRAREMSDASKSPQTTGYDVLDCDNATVNQPTSSGEMLVDQEDQENARQDNTATGAGRLLEKNARGGDFDQEVPNKRPRADALRRLLAENPMSAVSYESRTSSSDSDPEARYESSGESDTAANDSGIRAEHSSRERLLALGGEPAARTHSVGEVVIPRRVSGERDEIWAIDTNAIEPYKKVLKVTEIRGRNAMDVACFFACYLPPRSMPGYEHVMQNIFRYVMSALDLLGDRPYKLLFFNGAIPKGCHPRTGWLHQCYRMIDRRMQRGLLEMVIVHPNFWFKTQLQTVGRAVLSNAFYRKIRYVDSLDELQEALPGKDEWQLDQLGIPPQIMDFDRSRPRKFGRRVSLSSWSRTASLDATA